LSSTVNVYADITIQAAITVQEFLTDFIVPPGVGHVQLLTMTQYPFMLIPPLNITSNVTWAGLSVTADPQNGVTTCLDNGQVCIQYWDIVIDPSVIQCTLDGAYWFGFNIGCQASFGNNCPLPLGSNTGIIEFNLTSEYFCPQVIETVDLSGTMNSFSDNTYTIPKFNFITNQTVYFLATVNSNAATIISTVVDTATIIFTNGSSFLLYSGGTDTAFGTQINCVVTNNALSPETDTITFYLLDSLFAPIDFQNSETFTLEVTLTVTFSNTAKRSIETTTTSQQYSYQSPVTVSGTGANPTVPSNTSNTSNTSNSSISTSLTTTGENSPVRAPNKSDAGALAMPVMLMMLQFLGLFGLILV